jgi:uncharacterized protein YgiM (DUF1202 family)
MIKRISVFLVIGLWLAGCDLATYQPLAALQAAPAGASATATAAITATATAAACVVNTSALNLRAGPGLTYSVIAWPIAREILTLTGRTSGAWAEVRTAQNITGWVNSNYCKGK